MKRIGTTLLLALLVTACASNKKKLEEVDNSQTIKRDYEVRDATSSLRPAWIAEPVEWAAQNEKDTNKYRYFSFETEPKSNRRIACSLAKANVKADIAGEISTFIKKTLGSTIEGDASIDANNPQVKELNEYVDSTLVEKIQAMINGASIEKTYWEKRQYLQKLGAVKNHIGYTCGVLVRIEKDRLQAAIDRASEIISKKAVNPELKEKVKSAIEKAEEDFVKTRQGEI